MLNIMSNPGAGVKEYLEKLGTTVLFSLMGTTFSNPYKAVIQPLRYKNKMYLDGKNSPIGHVDQSHYLYIGPYDVNVASSIGTSVLQIGSKKYAFTRAEKVEVNNQTVYYWAVIRPYIE